MILAVVIAFGLPAVEAGAHYHYDSFLKLCWLPTHLEKNMEIRFVIFVSFETKMFWKKLSAWNNKLICSFAKLYKIKDLKQQNTFTIKPCLQAFGFLSFIMIVLISFLYLLVQAHRSEASFKQSTGNRCSLIFGQIFIMKTRFWSLHSHAAIWITMATILLYLPLTVYNFNCSAFENVC